MAHLRPLAFLVIWAGVAVLLSSLVPGLPDLFEPRTAGFVLALPWLLSFAGTGPGEVLRAFGDPLTGRAGDLPLDRRRRSVLILRKLGGLSISAGVVAFFATAIASLNTIAASGGQANPLEVIGAAPTAFLAPFYGYLLSAFVYGPLAASIDCEDSGLGLELEQS